MIPKIIHFCWFGNKPMNYMARKCVKSFKKLGGGGSKNGMSPIQICPVQTS